MPAKKIPYPFVADFLSGVDYRVVPMFGCQLFYVGEKMALLLRQREKQPEYNGVYVASLIEYHDSLRATLGLGRRCELFQNEHPQWLFLAEEDAKFESAVLTACQLIKKGDKRVGKEKRSKP